MNKNIKSAAVKSEECQFAQMVLETFQSSGLSVKQFCKNEGIPEWKFYQYKRVLRQKSVDDKNAATSEPNKSTLRFTQIAHLSQSISVMRVDFPSGISIHISNGCDSQLLRETLKSMQC